ncbi:MAG: hypothetical protein IPM98_04320 [Lewinellaceae bacterium]|nr:hypothetical protein [Lewinellaceae bacterium]
MLSCRPVFPLVAGLFCCHIALAQLTVSGGYLIIPAGSNVVSTGLSIHNNSGASITTQGMLSTTEHIANASGAALTGNGLWKLGGNWANAGTFLAGTSTVLFDGSGGSTVAAGGAAFHQLHVGKNSNNLTLASAVTVNDEVRFLTNNNKIVCGNFDCTVGEAATIAGADSTDFFVTNGSGFLQRRALGATAFAFPVGADTDTYNPLTLAENGTPDTLGVRCLPQPFANGLSGNPIAADAVHAAWEVAESTAGGSDLTATAQWVLADEQSGFVRADCGVARFDTGADWDLPPANMGAAAGSGPYTRTRIGLAPGVFAVLDEAFLNRVKIAPRIMLQGPYNTSTMKMNDNLRTLAVFPLAAPATYGAGKFVHTGWQPVGGYSIPASVLSVSGDNAIVDWVFIWLKNPANPATNIQTSVALVQKDGDVVDLDGASPVRIPANAGNYILAVGHRNHLSVRSPNGAGIALNETTATPYDFTSGMAQAFGANPMKQVQTSPAIFALWGGNTSVNNTVRATGPPTINDYSVILNTLGYPTNILPNVYSNSDVNMDGTVRVTGPPTINDYSKLLSILGTPTNIITEQQ